MYYCIIGGCVGLEHVKAEQIKVGGGRGDFFYVEF